MKWLLLTALAGCALVTKAQVANKPKHYHIIASFITDLNNDGKADTIRLASSGNIAGEFNGISISLAGYRKKTFYAREHWEKIDAFFPDTNKNAVNTRLFFLKKTKKQAVILLFGKLDDAGYREEFAILNIENNSVKKVLDGSVDDDKSDGDIEIPITLTDLRHNGRLCFVYKNFGEEIKSVPGGTVNTYNPFYVYPVDDSCKMSDSLTYQYNEKYYINPKRDDGGDIEIFVPKNGGKPRVYKPKKKSS